VSASVVGDRAEVVVNVEPDYPYWIYCVQRGGHSAEDVSGNGPSIGWADPDVIDWGEQHRSAASCGHPPAIRSTTA
jgi:hypothetical protein